jgi:hypothetical protein
MTDRGVAMTGKRPLAAAAITAMAVLGFMAPPAGAEAPHGFVDDPPAELLPADFAATSSRSPCCLTTTPAEPSTSPRMVTAPLYFQEHFRDVDTFTNTLNNKTFTSVNIGNRSGPEDRRRRRRHSHDHVQSGVSATRLRTGRDASLPHSGPVPDARNHQYERDSDRPSDDEPVDGTFSIVKDFVDHDETAGQDFCQTSSRSSHNRSTSCRPAGRCPYVDSNVPASCGRQRGSRAPICRRKSCAG